MPRRGRRRSWGGTIANAASGWRVGFIPPPAPLPDIGIRDGIADAAALQTAIWGGKRLRVPIGVAGGDEAVAVVVTALTQSGVAAQTTDGAGAEGGAVRLVWLAPGAE